MKCNAIIGAAFAALIGASACSSSENGNQAGSGRLGVSGPPAGLSPGTAGSTTTAGGFAAQSGLASSTQGSSGLSGGLTGASGRAMVANTGTSGRAPVPPGGGGVTGGGRAGATSAAGSAGMIVGSGPVNTGKDPKIPDVKGDCPKFMSGTQDWGGWTGIQMEVGPKSNGGGSLVFYWHGTGSFAGEYAISGLAPKVTAEGGILVSPQAGTGKGSDCSGTGTFSQGDFDVADQIAACAVRDYAIDPHRIYTTGCSAGGLQAGCMATLRSSYVAAAVPNSGGITFPLQLQDPSHVPALMTMHGDDMDMVIVYFKDTSNSLDNQFKMAGGFVIDCDHGGGHCGAPAELYASGWDFMKAHPFGINPSPYAAGLPASFPKYCKIW
jgi:predicted esterase